jgi:hypothetical protein
MVLAVSRLVTAARVDRPERRLMVVFAHHLGVRPRLLSRLHVSYDGLGGDRGRPG